MLSDRLKSSSFVRVHQSSSRCILYASSSCFTDSGDFCERPANRLVLLVDCKITVCPIMCICGVPSIPASFNMLVGISIPSGLRVVCIFMALIAVCTCYISIALAAACRIMSASSEVTHPSPLTSAASLCTPLAAIFPIFFISPIYFTPTCSD